MTTIKAKNNKQSNIGEINMENKIVANDYSNVIIANYNIKEIVKSEIERLGNKADLNHINVRNVTNMSGLFEDSDFNGDISKWNVGNVRDMRDMFWNSKFNGDISKWNVSNVEYMGGMFYESQFNGDISKWNVGNVRDMYCMFF